MTDVKNGDKVRLTIEGVVEESDGRGGFRVDTDGGDGWRVYGNKDYGIKVLKPRAYPVGTSVQIIRQTAFKTTQGWVWYDGTKSSFDDDYFRDYTGMVVLYEPPE